MNGHHDPDTTPNPRVAAAAIDRIRRLQSPCRNGTVTRDITNGWLTVRPGQLCGDVPSAPGNRVNFQSPVHPITAADIAEALDATRELGKDTGTRTYLWLAPWAVNADTEQALAAAGAKRWPYVHYDAFVRPAAPDTNPPTPAAPQGSLTVRTLTGGELDAALARIAPWYSRDGADTARRTVAECGAQAFFAFDADTPIAMALLLTEPNPMWSYLGYAGTDPAHRNRGAQKALIRARVAAAHARGGRWCLCETNTTVPVSLTNLMRCGFTPFIKWHVYRWDKGDA